MQRVIFLSLLSIFMVSVCHAMNAPQLSLGTTQILPLPGQVVEVIATGGDPISGVSLGLQIGDANGLADEPVFTSLSFAAGPFDDVPHVIGNSGPVLSDPNLIEGFILTASPTDTFLPEGVVAEVTIDASGFDVGQQFTLVWEWLTNMPGAAVSSVVLEDQEVVVSPNAVVLTVVPEPSAGVLVVTAVSLLTSRRQRGSFR